MFAVRWQVRPHLFRCKMSSVGRCIQLQTFSGKISYLSVFGCKPENGMENIFKCLVGT